MSAVSFPAAWAEIARGRLALQWPPLLGATSYAVRASPDGLDVLATRTTDGLVIAEVLTNDFRNAGDPDAGTYTVLCFERNRGRFCGVSLVEATERELEQVRRKAGAFYRFGTLADLPPHGASMSVQPVVVHDNGEYYACLHEISLWPSVEGDALATEPRPGDREAFCYVPVRVEKSERVEGPFSFTLDMIQDSGGVATVQNLLAALGAAGHLGSPAVKTIKRKKTVVPPPALPEPAIDIRNRADDLALLFETAGGRLFAGMYHGTQIVPVEVDRLGFNALRQSVDLVRAGRAWLRPVLAAVARVEADGNVVVAGTSLDRPPAKRARLIE